MTPNYRRGSPTDSSKSLPQATSTVGPWALLHETKCSRPSRAPGRGTSDVHLPLTLGLISCHFSCSK